MYCKKCGKEVVDNRDYCEECTTIETQEKTSKTYGIISIVSAGLGLLGYFPIIGPILAIIFGNLSKNTRGEKFGKIGKIGGIVGVIEYGIGIIASIIIACITLLTSSLLPFIFKLILLVVEYLMNL